MQRGPKLYANEYGDPAVIAEVNGVVALRKLVNRNETITTTAIKRLAGISKEQAELVLRNWERGRYECVGRP